MTTLTCVKINADDETLNSYIAWCVKYVDDSKWWTGFAFNYFYFEDEQDATAFKLRFKL
jgi:hypothetical protein